jgi:hypothetical protein
LPANFKGVAGSTHIGRPWLATRIDTVKLQDSGIVQHPVTMGGNKLPVVVRESKACLLNITVQYNGARQAPPGFCFHPLQDLFDPGVARFTPCWTDDDGQSMAGKQQIAHQILAQ